MARLTHAALSVAVLALCTARAVTAADVSFDASLGFGVSEDERVFLRITNDYFRPPQAVATRIVRGCHRPEDEYPTILFLAGASRRPAEEILRLRLEELSWADIIVRLRIPPSSLFAGLTREPGPPYGRAWGHWKNHAGKGAVVVSDREVVELVKLQIAAGHFRVSPLTVAAERKKGVRIERYVAERQRARHTKTGPRGHGPGAKEKKEKTNRE
jgi:hypothetical protein